MSVLPTLKPEELVRILEKFGYQRYRQKGSHLIMIKKGSYYLQLFLSITAISRKEHCEQLFAKQA